MTNPDNATANPELTTPDPEHRANTEFLIWQALGGIRESIGRLDGKLDGINSAIGDLGTKASSADGKLSKVKSSVDRIYWTIGAIVIVIGAMSPILWAGIKVLLKIP